MEEILSLIGVGASAASGGVFGLLGSVFGAWMKAKERKVRALEKAAEREHEINLINLRMQAKSQGASWDALTATHQAEIELNGQENYKWVVAIKSLFRPFLTLTLWILVAWELNMLLVGTFNEYLYTIDDQGGALFTTKELVDLARYILYSTVFSATTATTWWFGERALSLPDYKNR